MMIVSLRHRSARKRKAVSAVLAGIIMFTALLTVGMALFVGITVNEGNQARANASAQSAAQAAAQESLALTVGKDGSNNLALDVKNSGSTAATIVSVFVTNSIGQLVSTGLATPYLTGTPYLNVSLPLTVPVGASTPQMTGCAAKTGCNIGIVNPTGYAYSGGTVLVTVLTAAGNKFSAQYPPALNAVTSTQTNTIVASSTTVTSVSSTSSSTSTTTTVTTSTDCFGCTTTTALGEGTPALQIISIVGCAAESGWTGCEGAGELGYVLYGGPILLTVTVQNLALVQATNVQLIVAPTNGIPSGSNVYALPPGSGQPATCTSTQTIPATSTATYVCEYNGYFIGTGGTVTFTAYSTGTISSQQITSAEATSNPVQIGAFTSIGPWAPDVLHFYFTSKQSPSQTPGDYITVDNQYVAFYISVTNTYSQPLTILSYSFLMNVRAGSDPTWFLVDGMNTGGTPSISKTYPTTCASASPPAGCITVPSSSEQQLIFAATDSGGNSMMWQSQYPESLNPLPDGNSVLINIFYYYNGQIYSQALPFQSTIYDKANPTATTTLSQSTIDAGQSVTDTATLTGDSAYPPTGSVIFTAYSNPTCTTQVDSPSTKSISGSSATSGSFPFSSAGTYYFEASYQGDSDNNGYTTPCGLSGEVLLVNPALVAPVIKASPTSIFTGQSSTLSTTTSFTGGTLPDTCQWLQKAPAGSYSNLGTSFSCSPGGLPTVSTGTLNTAGTWNFELQVTDGVSATVTSSPVTVTVLLPLSVSISPASPTIDSGQSIALMASPSGGSGGYTYQWYSNVGCSTTIGGATSATYTTPSLTSAKSYCVKVTDSSSNTATSTVTVAVDTAVAAGAITPSSPAFNAGTSQTLTSHASGGTGTYSYQWYTAPSSGTCNTGDSAIAGATSSTYTIPTSQAGGIYYYCYIVTDSGVSAGATPPATASSSTDQVYIRSLTINPTSVSRSGNSGARTVTLTGAGYSTSTTYSYCMSTSSSTVSCVSGTTGTFTGSGSTGSIPGKTLVVPSGQARGTYYVIVYTGATVLIFSSLTVTT